MLRVGVAFPNGGVSDWDLRRAVNIPKQRRERDERLAEQKRQRATALRPRNRSAPSGLVWELSGRSAPFPDDEFDGPCLFCEPPFG